LQRVFSTENAVTAVTQSVPVCRDWNVSSDPNPSGLTTPAPIIATRRGILGGEFIMEFRTVKAFYLLLRFYPKAPTKAARKRSLGQLVNCQLSLFSGDLKSDYREQ
jgi:hypothetical protein